jgi:hypothetical protein
MGVLDVRQVVPWFPLKPVELVPSDAAGNTTSTPNSYAIRDTRYVLRIAYYATTRSLLECRSPPRAACSRCSAQELVLVISESAADRVEVRNPTRCWPADSSITRSDSVRSRPTQDGWGCALSCHSAGRARVEFSGCFGEVSGSRRIPGFHAFELVDIAPESGGSSPGRPPAAAAAGDATTHASAGTAETPPGIPRAENGPEQASGGSGREMLWIVRCDKGGWFGSTRAPRQASVAARARTTYNRALT